MNRELPDVQAGFRKSRGTNLLDHHKSKRVSEKHVLHFVDYAKAFDCVDHKKTVENSERDGNTTPPDLPPEKSVHRSRSNS